MRQVPGWGWMAAAAGMLVISAARCQPEPSQAANSGGGGGGPVASYTREALKLEAVPYETGTLIMGGTAYDVKLSTKKLEGRDDFAVVIALAKEDVVIEEERYRLNDSVFQYLGSAEESFEPPLNLWNFPLKVPSSSTWQGVFVWGSSRLDASAEVSVTADPLNLASGAVEDAVLVLVKLAIKEASGNIAHREFKFWVAPDRGVIRRDFAAVSSREPAGAAAAAQ